MVLSTNTSLVWYTWYILLKYNICAQLFLIFCYYTVQCLLYLSKLSYIAISSTMITTLVTSVKSFNKKYIAQLGAKIKIPSLQIYFCIFRNSQCATLKRFRRHVHFVQWCTVQKGFCKAKKFVFHVENKLCKISLRKNS